MFIVSDIDPKFIGQVFTAIPYSEVIGSPLSAMIEAQEKASNAMARFVLSVGFSEQDGVKHATSVDFRHSVKRSDGTEEIETITMPLITVIPVPNMQIIDGKISLDVEISSSAEFKENIEAGGELEGQVGWGPFSVSLKAKASYSKENTRKTDTRAKQHIELNVGQCPLPEGFNLIMERFRNNAMDKPAPDVPSLPPAAKPAIPANPESA